MGIRSIKAALAEAREHYHTIAQELTPPEQAVLFAKIKDLQTMLSNAICEGANPCPDCGGPPIGIEQPSPNGEEYEVGCPRCGWFLHTDGTARDHGSRGGLLPRHAVEAWNEGPDHWRRPTKAKDTSAFRATLKPRKQKDGE